MNGDFIGSLADILVDVEDMSPVPTVPRGGTQRGSWLQALYDLLQGLGNRSTGREGAGTRPPVTPETLPTGTIAVLTGSDKLQALYDLTRFFLGTRAANRYAANLRDIAANPQYPSWLRQSWANEKSPGGQGRYGSPMDYGTPRPQPSPLAKPRLK